jgi:hypothetical protein
LKDTWLVRTERLHGAASINASLQRRVLRPILVCADFDGQDHLTMGLFDTIKCEYPLPNGLHQELEFQTKDLECSMAHYTITRDGRLIRRHRPGRPGPERDIEWPIHGDIRIYDLDPNEQFVEYSVRFTHGRVEWVRPGGEQYGGPTEPKVGMPAPSVPHGLIPAMSGRRLTVKEFAANTPEKLELVDGEIPGSEELLLLLLTSFGLRRAALLVGPDRWKKALIDDETSEN